MRSCLHNAYGSVTLQPAVRHARATLLLTKNVNPKVVSEMLGHATIAITLDTYSHVLSNM